MNSSRTVFLIRGAEAGDEQGYQQLYDQNATWMRSAAGLLLGRNLLHVGVEDLLQETFAYAFDKIRSGEFKANDTEGAFRAYLSRILENKARDLGRRERTQARGKGQVRALGDVFESTILHLGVRSDAATPSQHAMGGELFIGMAEALEELSGQDRKILHLRLNCEMSYEEILPQLTQMKDGQPLLDDAGRPIPVQKIGTAKSMFSRARQKLRDMLVEKGLLSEAP